MKAVLDTNVLVSSALSPAGTCDRIIQAAFLMKFSVCTTNHILDEYAEVLPRPHLKLAAESVAAILTYFRDAARRFPDEPLILNLPDPDDEIFLAAAITAQTDFLVTGNLKHFPPHQRRGVNVVTSAQFLKHLSTT